MEAVGKEEARAIMEEISKLDEAISKIIDGIASIKFGYHFPEILDDGITSDTQADKILGEAQEVIFAKIIDEQLEEVMDVYHACETYFRLFPTEMVREVRDKVEAKNRRRGYYSKFKEEG